MPGCRPAHKKVIERKRQSHSPLVHFGVIFWDGDLDRSLRPYGATTDGSPDYRGWSRLIHERNGGVKYVFKIDALHGGDVDERGEKILSAKAGSRITL